MRTFSGEAICITILSLMPVATANSVKVREGRRLITDGPFAETHEQLGGYFLVEPKIPMRQLLLRAAFPLL
ncbi:MAG: YciI family protein [Methylosarcina sp.]